MPFIIIAAAAAAAVMPCHFSYAASFRRYFRSNKNNSECNSAPRRYLLRAASCRAHLSAMPPKECRHRCRCFRYDCRYELSIQRIRADSNNNGATLRLFAAITRVTPLFAMLMPHAVKAFIRRWPHTLLLLDDTDVYAAAMMLPPAAADVY